MTAARRSRDSLHWTLETLEGEVLEGGDQTIQAAPISSACQLRLDFSHPKKRVDWRKTILVVTLFESEAFLSRSVVSFVAEKSMPLGDPGLQAQVELVDNRLLVHLSTRRLARFIELKLDGASLVFSDNYFDLPANRSAVVECALPDGWDVEQAQAALRVRSLGEIGPVDSALVTGLKANIALVECVAKTVFPLLVNR